MNPKMIFVLIVIFTYIYDQFANIARNLDHWAIVQFV
jgi:hypothetical protein